MTAVEPAVDPARPPDPADYDVWTLDQVEIAMRLVAREMWRLHEKDGRIDQATRAEADARHAYDVEHAKARLRSRVENPEFRVDDHDAQATIDTEGLLLAKETAVGVRRAVFARLSALEKELSALQSVHAHRRDLERRA